MAKEPDSRPITVEELISRAGQVGDHFPRADSVAVFREAGEAGQEAAAHAPGASGMPDYAKPVVKPRARIIGASGMPAYTPAPAVGPDESPNVVTGIIPVVTDQQAVDTGALRAVDADDLIGVELPATESELPRATVIEATGALPATTVVRAGAAPVNANPDDDLFADFDDTTVAALVDAGAAEGGDHLASAGELAAAQDSALLLDDDGEPTGEGGKPDRSPLWGWLALVGEVVLGLAVGAGLFWGFTVLWKQYVYLALVLAVVGIFAVVTFAYVLRKRDLPTTLLALAVGVIVTIGPLVLLV